MNLPLRRRVRKTRFLNTAKLNLFGITLFKLVLKKGDLTIVNPTAEPFKRTPCRRPQIIAPRSTVVIKSLPLGPAEAILENFLEPSAL